jgi:hypothetical protein
MQLSKLTPRRKKKNRKKELPFAEKIPSPGSFFCPAVATLKSEMINRPDVTGMIFAVLMITFSKK